MDEKMKKQFRKEKFLKEKLIRILPIFQGKSILLTHEDSMKHIRGKIVERRYIQPASDEITIKPKIKD
ncbi:MAG: hypothetical protein KKD44_28725 [Proteobacteria bacterium]|nr:hypothetical protein [Pseudomonadota bacterium]